MIDYSTLNEAQLEAVQTTEGYIRVVASAGSGKTRALAFRYAFLVDEIGIDPQNIACVTFTNKAANEMKERIKGMLGDFDTVYICTFHGLGAKILHEEIQTIGWPSEFKIMDDEDINAMLRRICKKLGIRSMPNLKDVKDFIATQKTRVDPAYVAKLATEPHIITKSSNTFVTLDEIYAAYLNEQRRGACLDFNDLILIPLYLFAAYPEIQNKWAKRFEYVMVDEYQDVSGGNYRFCEAISSFHKNLFVVGDPDQLIYSWRGAKMKYIMNFDRIHENAKTIMMSTNYRCSGEIIGVANELVEKNQIRLKKTMVPHREDMEQVQYYHTEQPADAGDFVANEIMKLHSKGVPYHDIALLYRAHYVSGTYEKELIRNKIPYMVCSGTPFYQRKEIKDILSYLGFVNRENPIDFARALTAPNRELTTDQIDMILTESEETKASLLEILEQRHGNNSDVVKFIQIIRKYQGEKGHATVSEMLSDIFTESGLETEYRYRPDDERLQNVLTLKNQVLEMEKARSKRLKLQEFLDEVGTYTGEDNKATKESVSLMTVHGAKGLEFPYVFCVGMNESIFPSYRINDAEMMEEERRLAYVAYTRAKDKLYIVEAEKSALDGKLIYPSRFIFDAGLNRMHSINALKDDFIKQATEHISQSQSRLGSADASNMHEEDEWNIGTIVEHAVFGKGSIQSIQSNMITVAFDSGATRTLRKDKLKKIEQEPVHEEKRNESHDTYDLSDFDIEPIDQIARADGFIIDEDGHWVPMEDSDGYGEY